MYDRFIKIKFVVFIFAFILLMGCGHTHRVNNSLTEEEIIKYVQDQIYNETGDITNVRIIEKKDLKVCSLYIDSCWNYKNVGHSYSLEITNEKTKKVAHGSYTDAYIKDDKIVPQSFESNYAELIGLIFAKNEIINTLNLNFNKSFVYEKEDGEFDIFVQTLDCEKIDNTLKSINNIVRKSNIGFSLYIYKSESIFNSLEFDKYIKEYNDLSKDLYGESLIKSYTRKDVVNIDNDAGFNCTWFNSNGISTTNVSEDNNDFDYYIFWYKSSLNSIGSTELFGIK